MATLELDPITKTFQDGDDEIIAVDDILISVDDGESLVVAGPSGYGKSTTLRMIAGLETVTSGTISLGDRVINDVASQDRDIVVVFQSYVLYPHTTVRQSTSFGLEESTDLPDNEIGRMVSEMADLLDTPSLLDRKPSDLSGDRQQHVVLGHVIVCDPEVFLTDGPLSNLDTELRVQMRTELQRLQDDFGVTTVYVTHDQTEAMTMGDRIATLDGGEFWRTATPLECYREPANQFVASFLGESSMNFLDVTREDDRLVGDSSEYSAGAEIRDDIGDVTDLVLGVRPEPVELVEAVSDGHDFEMVADVVEPMGDENMPYLYFEPDADPKTAGTLAATTDGLTHISPGETVVAQTPEEAIHFFDDRAGEALHNWPMEETAQQVDLG